MAFSVTPTSGDAPYTLSASFVDTTYIDGVNYRVRVQSSVSVGSCPSIGTSEPLGVSQVNQLVVSGSTITNPVVPAGSCRTFTLDILRLSDNSVVDSSSVSVDNI